MTQELAVALVAVMSCTTACFEGCSCSISAPPPDASRPRDAGTEIPDARPVTVPGTAPVLAPCTETADCAPAPGVACLTSVPGGSCTRRCDGDIECGPEGTCVSNLCLRACTSRGGECVPVGACYPWRLAGGFCVPICYPSGREPPGAPGCSAGLVCDPYASVCTSTPPSTGADNGAPCRDDTECRGGFCWAETARAGFLDGMCSSLGVAPPPSSYVPGAPLPRGSCPEGSAVPPDQADRNTGDVLFCFPRCASDAECRPGYACAHLEVVSPSFADGLCQPIDCASAPCPAGTACNGRVCVRTP